jgi:peptide/nickel transport system substrate-binding protein
MGSVLSLVIGALAGCSGTGTSTESGGKLVMAFRSAPTSFNRLVASRAPAPQVALLTQSTLLRVNPITHAIEPRLATDWQQGSDALTWTLHLRKNVQFSDDVPFTSADVVFTFAALYDDRLASDMASAYRVNGKPLVVRAIDNQTVTVTFPSAYGPGIRVLDSLPMLPAHKLSSALAAGTLRDAWGRSATPADVVGTGPFVLAENTPGQTMRFTRNPHYWATDDKGHALPYLDEIDVQVIQNQDAEMLRFESGDLDLTNDFIRPEDISKLRTMASQQKASLVEAGVGIDPSALWFDLSPQSKAARNRPWLQRDELRQAISMAVDRQAIVDGVYLGLAVPIGGPVTPGFGDWYSSDVPAPAHDPSRAKALLASIGLTDRHGTGTLTDAAGKPARFSLLTQQGKTEREGVAALVAAQLKAIGLTVDVATLDFNSVLSRVLGDDYDAVYFGANTSSTDPADNLQFWMSSGPFHLWNMHEDKAPATPWEAHIDAVMRRQVASMDDAERHRLFADAQRTLAEHFPAIYFAAPKVTVAVGTRVHGVRASVVQPSVLWNVDSLSVSPKPQGQ